MTRFRVDVDRDTGEVMLYMDMPCGEKPILGWPNEDGMKVFAQTLLGFCSEIENRKKNFDISEKLLSEVLDEFKNTI
jgi:hypothetical protein